MPADARTPPTDRQPSILRRSAAYAAFAVAAAIGGFFTMYSNFARYDDEGYILLSIKQFAAGGTLYQDVYTQYGPFPYELWGGLYAITGRSVTPDTGRALTLLVWIAIALLIGLVVERLTARVSLGLAAAVVGFATAIPITSEPIHPGGLADLLLIGIVAAAVLLERRPHLRMGFIGAFAAALVLTKINIGGLAVAAICLALSASSGVLRGRRWLTPALVAGCVLLPFVLTARDLRSAWTQDVATLVAVSIAAVGVVLTDVRRAPKVERDEPRALAVLLGSFVAAIAVIVGVIVLNGTSPGSLFHGVVVAPLSLRDAFSLQGRMSPLAIDLGFAGLVAAVVAVRLPAAPGPSLFGGVGRVVVALTIWLLASGTLPIAIMPSPGPLTLAIPLAWVAALAPRGRSADSAPGPLARALLPALAVLGALAIYPVAGSQVGFAAVLFVPVGGLILADGLRSLADRHAARGPEQAAVARTVISLGAVALTAILAYQVLLQPAIVAADAYGRLKPLPFGGATRVRQPAAATDALAQIVAGLRTRCDTFVSLPGMNSFYLWSQMRPPTGLNTGSWMYLLDSADQQRIVDAIKPVRRLCLVRSDQVLATWVSPARPLPQRPLLRFVEQEFTPADQAGAYQLMVRRP